MLSTSGGQSRVQAESGSGSLFAPHLRLVRKGKFVSKKQERSQTFDGPPRRQDLHNLVFSPGAFLIQQQVESERDSRVCHRLIGAFLLCTVEV